MRKFVLCTLLGLGVLGGFRSAMSQPDRNLRPPSVPLVAHDPYFSIWSPGDKLAEVDTVHWTGAKHRLNAQVKVDGVSYRLMGSGTGASLSQKELKVLPTRTIYRFEGAGVALTLTFLTPSLPGDLDVLARPVTYVEWEVRSTTSATHDVAFEFGASGEIAANRPDQKVRARKTKVGSLEVLSVGTVDQPVLMAKGDAIRIDWGHLLLAAEGSLLESGAVTSGSTNAEKAQLAFKFKGQKVGAKAVSNHLMVAYDDDYSIQYFGENLRPFWKRKGMTSAQMLSVAGKEFAGLKKKCEAFDAELMADLRKAGGEKYAELCALAFRQTWAGCKLAADANGQPLLFPKENTSNGCIATVDVIYPMAPQFLLFGASLTKAMLVPILDYSMSPRWKFPFAPHDLGTYPQSNGQVYGGGERTEENQMPVEESANMLILLAALAEMEGNAKFCDKYWPAITKWAKYLEEKGFDPENQLCTDDFLGHLAHNVNLSAKAIMGLASYAKLAEFRGDAAGARFGAVAKKFADQWIAAAAGGLSRLAFDKEGTWSQKYNLVWDRLLGFGLFPEPVLRREMDHYRKVMNPFGLPLDSRGTGAKLDWSLWTATLTQDPKDFAAIMEPVFRFVDETPQRVGMGDWYNTASGHHNFMHSRPVVGGVFLQVLYAKDTWAKWASRDTAKASNWAPMPVLPKVTTVIPGADTKGSTWAYTLDRPAADWIKPGFDASFWLSGAGGFGTRETPGAVVGTVWNTADIWIRREFSLTKEQLEDLSLWIHHDEDADVYLNGVLACSLKGWTTQYEARALTAAGKRALKAGRNVVAIHCHQTSGGQFIDAGFVRLERKK